MQKNHAKQTEQGMYLEGEPFDYLVLSDGVLLEFEERKVKPAKQHTYV